MRSPWSPKEQQHCSYLTLKILIPHDLVCCLYREMQPSQAIEIQSGEKTTKLSQKGSQKNAVVLETNLIPSKWFW